MPRRGQYRKKRRTHKAGDVSEAQEEFRKSPKSLIVRWKQLTPASKQLVTDLRLMMSPYNSLHLKESSRNKLTDYLTMCQSYDLSHLILVSQTASSAYLRILQYPHGPAFTFKIKEFSLRRDVQTEVCHDPYLNISNSKNHPLALLSYTDLKKKNTDFGTKSSSVCFSSLFPSIQFGADEVVRQLQRRLVLFQFEPDCSNINVRHYNILPSSNQLADSISKLKNKPRLLSQELGKLCEQLSNSKSCESTTDEHRFSFSVDPEDHPTSKIYVKLREIGPRLNLKLLRIEKDQFHGEVLYHHGKSSDSVASSNKTSQG